VLVLQYLNYTMMKKQLDIMGAFVKKRQDPETLNWLKLLFQRALDGEISKMLDFYKFRAHALHEDVENLEKKEKHTLLSILNVCASDFPRPKWPLT
jgi:SPX domain protein involved in polyphosphate accumulation